MALTYGVDFSCTRDQQSCRAIRTSLVTAVNDLKRRLIPASSSGSGVINAADAVAISERTGFMRDSLNGVTSEAVIRNAEALLARAPAPAPTMDAAAAFMAQWFGGRVAETQRAAPVDLVTMTTAPREYVPPAPPPPPVPPQWESGGELAYGAEKKGTNPLFVMAAISVGAWLLK